jgi:plastocyanin
MKFIVAAILVFAGVLSVEATNFQVTVGTGGLKYNPSTVNAAVGDTVEFIVDGVPKSKKV